MLKKTIYLLYIFLFIILISACGKLDLDYTIKNSQFDFKWANTDEKTFIQVYPIGDHYLAYYTENNKQYYKLIDDEEKIIWEKDTYPIGGNPLIGSDKAIIGYFNETDSKAYYLTLNKDGSIKEEKGPFNALNISTIASNMSYVITDNNQVVVFDEDLEEKFTYKAASDKHITQIEKANDEKYLVKEQNKENEIAYFTILDDQGKNPWQKAYTNIKSLDFNGNLLVTTTNTENEDYILELSYDGDTLNQIGPIQLGKMYYSGSTIINDNVHISKDNDYFYTLTFNENNETVITKYTSNFEKQKEFGSYKNVNLSALFDDYFLVYTQRNSISKGQLYKHDLNGNEIFNHEIKVQKIISSKENENLLFMSSGDNFFYTKIDDNKERVFILGSYPFISQYINTKNETIFVAKDDVGLDSIYKVTHLGKRKYEYGPMLRVNFTTVLDNGDIFMMYIGKDHKNYFAIINKDNEMIENKAYFGGQILNKENTISIYFKDGDKMKQFTVKSDSLSENYQSLLEEVV